MTYRNLANKLVRNYLLCYNAIDAYFVSGLGMSQMGAVSEFK